MVENDGPPERPSGLWTIGMLARRSGLAVSAIRFYADRGLITSLRTPAGHRRFRAQTLRRLAVIQAGQRVGLSLAEIGAALRAVPPEAGPSGAEWRVMADAWRPLLDARIAILERLRDQLDACTGCGCLSLRRCALTNPDDRASTLGAGPHYLLGDAGLPDADP